MPTKFYDKLSQDFTKLLELGDGYDVIIHVGDDNGEECKSKMDHVCDDKDEKKIQKSFKLHSAILRFRSEYFNKELTDLTGPRNIQNVMEIRKKHFKPEDLETSRIFELMITANELCLEELVNYLESYLVDTRADWLCLNFALIHNTGYQSENLLLWAELVQKFPESDLLKSPFGSPPQSSTHLLRVTSSSVIPLYSDSPPISPPLPSFSVIITNEHAAQIATWIDRRLSTYTVANSPYEFKLLLRGSEHGFKNKTFHDICDSRSRTVVIMKVSGTNEILGGYNPLKWNNHVQESKNNVKGIKSKQDNWSSTKDSFIFSLSEENCILSRVSNPGYAFYYNARWGPNFGNHDLKMVSNYRNGKGIGCKQVNYEKPIRKSSDPFSIDDYEVFQICPKGE
ncbi:13623_t:CDS:2 [Acaulospora colombiana]|uniref:13623_t:CDS:1 n=1 Tax=Acaulospora colombiana TaxID=27376 RepID=A0ACA9LRX1_9GLOM|nr:13623_t:CDS:2 [Acaulospora colombiana]